SDGVPQQTIPETNPTARRGLFRNSDSIPLGEDSPNNDDGLPPIPRHGTTGHQSQAHSHSTDVAKEIPSDPVSALFSSPSGRQRRTMTEIATDMSPRPALPDVRL